MIELAIALPVARLDPELTTSLKPCWIIPICSESRGKVFNTRVSTVEASVPRLPLDPAS